MTKKCPRCNKVLDQNFFNWKIKDKILAAYCKSCSRRYVSEHYSKNKQYYIDKALKRRKNLKERAIEFLQHYLLTHPCVDCGEKDILVLEFDHVHRAEKEGEISKMLHIGFQLDKLINEISKCEVRCANCHRRKTQKESQSWKLTLPLVQ